jgi:predicted TIM-barrel fold metal-dependent hydrolase
MKAPTYKGIDIPKIDVHVHALPPAYREGLLTRGEEYPDGFPTPYWNPEAHIAFMNQLGIATAMLSISSPHLNFGDDEVARQLARNVNEYAADLVVKHPGRFGLLASLPLPDADASIEEIEHCVDVLAADGFTVPTNTQGVYLGNPYLDPVMEELDKREAVVVLHPNKPSAVPENVVEGLPVPMMEFLFDTTRTVTNMMLKGTFKRFPNIKFVIPHAGAFLSILADRIAMVGSVLPNLAPKLDVFGDLKRLYYDIAGMCLPRQLAALLTLVDPSHLLYGSDFPYTPESGCILLAQGLDKTPLLTDEQRQAVYHDNALALFPRLHSVEESLGRC